MMKLMTMAVAVLTTAVGLADGVRLDISGETARLQAQFDRRIAVREPVDWVNAEIGHISHLLVPTFPTVQVPNGMLRFQPPCRSFTDDRVGGIRLTIQAHRADGLFCVHPLSAKDADLFARWTGTWDQLHVRPYRCQFVIDSEGVSFDLVPARRSALAAFAFDRSDGEATLVFSPVTRTGTMVWKGGSVVGSETFNGLPVTLHAVFDRAPDSVVCGPKGQLALRFGPGAKTVKMRYAHSYIDAETAAKAIAEEIPGWDLDAAAAVARKAWNDRLGKIEVEGGTDAERRVFYTALYRCYERMVNFTEGGRYRGYDGKVHETDGVDYYSDDWTWDTYRAAHPLMCLLEPAAERAKLTSYLRMARETDEKWVPTFPQIGKDAHGMNGFHPPALFLDALVKGVGGVDWAEAYRLLAHTERTCSRVPWNRGPRCAIDEQTDRLGYMPAIPAPEVGEPWRKDEEWPSTATHNERRQAVAATLAYSFDSWCLMKLAERYGTAADVDEFREKSLRYRNLWKTDTQFFHPRDKEGKWIPIGDYAMAGGQGGREYYDENNAWTYVWDVQHDIPGLVGLFGGKEPFLRKLDALFNEKPKCARWEFLSRWPDSTSMMGMFSMGNEPSFHIPYLYAKVGEPAKTQKLVRKILKAWFRDDLMGMPGDEDGGGMSAFAVFSMMGFYPITPGEPEYVWGSPVFTRVRIHQENGRTFTIEAPQASEDAKYIRTVLRGGKAADVTAPLPHAAILAGETVRLEMSTRPDSGMGCQRAVPVAGLEGAAAGRRRCANQSN